MVFVLFVWCPHWWWNVVNRRRQSSTPMYFGRAEEGRTAPPPAAPGPGHQDPPSLPAVQLADGLGEEMNTYTSTYIPIQQSVSQSWHKSSSFFIYILFIRLFIRSGFSEFVEAISRVAEQGMQQETYNNLFPSPFSKIVALLTIWGLADLKKLEEVRAIHAEGTDLWVNGGRGGANNDVFIDGRTLVYFCV